LAASANSQPYPAEQGERIDAAAEAAIGYEARRHLPRFAGWRAYAAAKPGATVLRHADLDQP